MLDGRQVEGGSRTGSSLVRIHLDLGMEDPFTLLRERAPVQEVFAWNDPREDRCFVALGRADSASFEGPNRFRQAEVAWGEWAAALRTLEKDDTPLALGGFAFAAQPRGETWEGWPDGLLWVPRLLVQRRRNRTTAVFTARIDRGDTRPVLSNFEDCLLWLGALSNQARVDKALCLTPQDAGDPESRHRWQGQVEDALRSVADGLLQKVVLARQVDWQAPEGTRFDAGATAIALRDQQPDCTVFLVDGPGVGAFVGASPEELVRLSGGQVRTVALAGTAKRLEGEAEDIAAGNSLLTNEKDREEHRLVAEALRASLAPLSSELKEDEAPELASFADVHHLRTEFQATLKEGACLFDLVKGLHPTPAVGGLPNREALRWIQSHETRDRGWYAAPVGWVDSQGEGVFVVAIRSALVRGDRATAFAGCGLVSASDPVSEWNEALAKFRTLRQGIVHRPDEA